MATPVGGNYDAWALSLLGINFFGFRLNHVVDGQKSVLGSPPTLPAWCHSSARARRQAVVLPRVCST